MKLYENDYELTLDRIEDAARETVYEVIPQNTEDYYTEANFILKVQDDFYRVNVQFDMVGAWQDVGDKLYIIEVINEITYEKVEYDVIVNEFNDSIDHQIQQLTKQIQDLELKFIKVDFDK
jgi:hypothetical protein